MVGGSHAAFLVGQRAIRCLCCGLLSAVLWLSDAPSLRAQEFPPAATALVLQARAFDRANQLDSARRAYEAAAALLPRIADWLNLRAAGVAVDSADRQRLYAAVVVPVARGRIAWTEAEARERTSDFAGAARAYAAVGDSASVLRNAAAVAATAGDSSARAAFRLRLFGTMSRQPVVSVARSAVELADQLYGPLTSAEERLAARSAGVGGMWPRAIAGYARVLEIEGPAALSPEDTYAYASALARMHRDTDAARVFATLGPGHGPSALVHAASYQRARLMIGAGDKSGARRQLLATIRATPHDSVTASALMLLADLATDERHDDVARQYYLRVAREFRTTGLAPRAGFRASLIAFVNGAWAQAAREWDALAARYPRSEDLTAARYWGGRAWTRAGRTRLGAEHWRAVVRADPLSYYASLSERRLDSPGLLAIPPRDTVTPGVSPVIDSALARVALLETVGMSIESRFELDRVVHEAGGATEAMIGVGTSLVRAGEPSRAIALGWRLVGSSDSAWRDARILRLIYPLSYGDTLATAARERGLEPALVAAVVRQESAFNPRAVSSAGARGLMQVMPGVGRGLAQAQGIEAWDPAMLDQPGINLRLGTAHFATFRAQEHGDLVRTLAAYNAGPSRVHAWSAKRGTDDPEVFVERIPFAETKNYVRAILRGRELYQALYGL